jgi:hypothetical protein
MYVELDHGLVPRMIKDINERTELPGRDKKGQKGGKESNLINKYKVKTGNIQDVFLAFEVNKLDMKEKDKAEKAYWLGGSAPYKKKREGRTYENRCEAV